MKTTARTTKVVGTVEYLNISTGEIEPMQVTTVEERDYNFTKVWLRDFLQTLDIVSNKKMKVANWVIDNINYENMLIATYDDIIEGSGCSKRTVVVTMQALREANFLRLVRNGVYMVNPNVVFKGKRAARLNALVKYSQAGEPAEVVTPEQKLQKLLDLQAKVNEQIAELWAEIKTQEDTQETPAASPSASAAGQSPAPSAESDYRLEPLNEVREGEEMAALPVM